MSVQQPATRLVRTQHRHIGQRVQVSVVRIEDSHAAVWTIHLNGESPIYVALTRTDAFRVADAYSTR